MPDGRRRSREHWTDTMEAAPANPPAHVHRLPGAVRFAIGGLAAAILLLLVAVGVLTIYVYQANQYVQGRGEYRDREQQRLEEQIRQGMCDLLDQLPEGGLLERPRAKYGCGPGIPFDQLPPDVANNLRQQRGGSSYAPSSAVPVPSSSVPPPPVERPRAAPGPTPAPTPAAPTTRPPLVDLGPVTGPVCDAAIVCF